MFQVSSLATFALIPVSPSFPSNSYAVRHARPKMKGGVDLDYGELKARRDRLMAELQDVEQSMREVARDQPVAQRFGTGTRSSTFEPSFAYLSKSAGCYVDTDNTSPLDGRAGPPSNVFDLAARNFAREFGELTTAVLAKARDDGDPVCDAPEVLVANLASGATTEEMVKSAELRQELGKLVLSNDAIWAREREREEVRAPWIIKVPYYTLCFALDRFFDGRPIARFWFLETVARIPYFSYISMLHLYESLGWWRRSAETKQVHFAEEWNEFHHLLIMESLGGDQRWLDRFLGQHSAVVYYWVLIFLWLVSPSLAYNFSELIEAHAVDTYAEFVEANEERLRQLPAPRIAKLYYQAENMHYFDEFQTARPRGSRRPVVDNLYDVFSAIRDDEAEHVATMATCQDANVLTRAPSAEALIFLATTATIAYRLQPLEGLEDGLAESEVLFGTGVVASLLDSLVELMEQFGLQPFSDAFQEFVSSLLVFLERIGLS